nr:putative reverse transcriptase domain-containing protein [Tanacetum cinerariifolium]
MQNHSKQQPKASSLDPFSPRIAKVGVGGGGNRLDGECFVAAGGWQETHINPQEDEDDMEVNIEEDENELELTYPYEEVDPLNPSPLASESEPDNEIEDENFIEHEDETITVSVHKKGESSTADIPREDGDRLLPGFMRLDIGSLFVRSSVEQGNVAMEKLVKKLGNAEDKVECKKLKKELKRGFVFEERPSEAIKVSIEDEKSPLQEKVMNDASGSGPTRGRDTAPAIRESTFVGFMKCNHAVFRGVEGAVKLRRWFEKTKSVFEIRECTEGKKVKFATATLEGPALTWWKTKVATMGLEIMNQMPWAEMKQLMTAEFCLIEEIQRMKHELWNLKDNIKGEVTSSKHADINEAVRMAHKMMEQKSQTGNERILEISVRSSATSVERLDIRQGTVRRRVLLRVLTLNLFGLVMIVVSKVILGTDVRRRSFVNTRFSSLLDIKLIKINDSYKVELADGRLVSTNTVLKGYTLSLVNHIFEIDLMPIELSTFDVIIGMDWFVKYDAVIVCGEKVVRIPYRSKTLIVIGNK